MSSDERFTIDAEQATLRLDQVLAALPSVGSRGKARRALESGKVLLDGAVADPEQGGKPVAEGTEVHIAWNRPGTTHTRSAGRERLRRAGVEVLFEDGLLLAVNKPVGLLTDAATRAQNRNHDTLTKRARDWSGSREVWPVHRIDRDTSGVVLFAKSEAAREHLKAQWGGEKPRRAYLVVVEGLFDAPKGTWAHWMRWDTKGRRQVPCRPGSEEGVEAKAAYEVVEALKGASLLSVVLDTGRRNQIRLQAQLEGHPLVGEHVYRDGKPQGPIAFPRQALHAAELVVKHPRTEAPLKLTAPLPADMAGLLKRLRT